MCTSNYGASIGLQVDNSPVKHFLLKFDVIGVNGQTVTSAKIRLYNTDTASEGAAQAEEVTARSITDVRVRCKFSKSQIPSVIASRGKQSPNFEEVLGYIAVRLLRRSFDSAQDARLAMTSDS